jgi:hypothetical protein
MHIHGAEKNVEQSGAVWSVARQIRKKNAIIIDLETTRMATTVTRGGLTVADNLARFIETEALPGTGLTADAFWAAADDIIHKFAPKVSSLLRKRKTLQNKINRWHKQNAGGALDPVAYKSFLEEIGYLVPEKEAFKATTRNVDDEISTVAGPQLVVPVMNARYARKRHLRHHGLRGFRRLRRCRGQGRWPIATGSA